MKKVICIGESILSPLGETVQDNFGAVLRGESALQLHAGTFDVKEPFMASLLDRARWRVPGRTFFDTLIIEAARRAVEASGIDPASPRTAFILSSIKGNIEHIGTQDVTLAASARRLVEPSAIRIRRQSCPMPAYPGWPLFCRDAACSWEAASTRSLWSVLRSSPVSS